MILTLTRDDLATVSDRGFAVVVTGTSEDGGRVRFAGEPLAMGHLLLEIASGRPSMRIAVTEGQVVAESVTP